MAVEWTWIRYSVSLAEAGGSGADGSYDNVFVVVLKIIAFCVSGRDMMAVVGGVDE